jgi:hypothetical protein
MNMTTWTLEQIRQARTLRASMTVDDELLMKYGEDMDIRAKGEMAKALVRMGHPFGLDLSTSELADYEVVWERNEATPWHVMGHMRWSPSTRTAELRGGHLDGQRYNLRNIGEPFRVPRPMPSPFYDESATHATAAMVEMADTYELVGWREFAHVWVYACS